MRQFTVANWRNVPEIRELSPHDDEAVRRNGARLFVND